MEDYIPSDGFFIERLRISEDETNDLSSNGGFFHIRYEALVKNGSKISQLLNVDKLLEFPLPSLQDEMRRILFSLYKIYKVNLIKTDAVTDTGLVSLGITYDRENRSENPTRTSFLPGEVSDGDKEAYLKENLLDLKGPTPETIISYEFYDLDRYPSFYEISENERGGMKFKYDVSAIFTDNTMLIASVIEKMFTKEIVNLLNYFDFASEICSYNNIQNRFNDFFSAEITNFYEEREQPFPWETSVLAFCLVQYVLTDRFATIAELSNYSKNLISSINPYSGTLSSIQRLLLEMEEFQDQVFGSGSDYFNKKRELLSSTNEIEITKEFNISVKTQNPDRLDREASEEIEYFLNLFDDSSFIYFGNRSDPNNLPVLDSRNGGEYDYRDDVTYTTVSTSISDYYRTFVTENILPILENINMRFLDVNRVSGTRGLSYNVQSSLLRTDGTIEGESLYNLTEILQLGDKSSDDRDLLKFLRSSDKQKMQDELEQFFANWMAQMFYTLKKERDDFLLRGGLGNIMPVTDGGGGSSSVRGSIASGDPVFYLKFVTNLQNDLLDAIREAFYEAVASYENSSGSQIDDVQGGDRTSVKSFIYDISIGSRADNAIDQIARAATYYFRETTNQQKLFPDFQRSATLVSVGNAFARSILRTTGELYDSIKDPITQLPDFITDEDPYIRYTGPELDRIPNIEVSPDDVTES